MGRICSCCCCQWVRALPGGEPCECERGTGRSRQKVRAVSVPPPVPPPDTTTCPVTASVSLPLPSPGAERLPPARRRATSETRNSDAAAVGLAIAPTKASASLTAARDTARGEGRDCGGARDRMNAASTASLPPLLRRRRCIDSFAFSAAAAVVSAPDRAKRTEAAALVPKLCTGPRPERAAEPKDVGPFKLSRRCGAASLWRPDRKRLLPPAPRRLRLAARRPSASPLLRLRAEATAAALTNEPAARRGPGASLSSPCTADASDSDVDTAPADAALCERAEYDLSAAGERGRELPLPVSAREPAALVRGSGSGDGDGGIGIGRGGIATTASTVACAATAASSVRGDIASARLGEV